MRIAKKKKSPKIRGGGVRRVRPPPPLDPRLKEAEMVVV